MINWFLDMINWFFDDVQDRRLSSGGVRGVAFAGALDELVRLGALDLAPVTLFVGTSVGALFAAFLAVGRGARAPPRRAARLQPALQHPPEQPPVQPLLAPQVRRQVRPRRCPRRCQRCPRR